jgi:ribonuclease P protein component
MSAPKGEGFPKSVRLRRRREFLRVQDAGRKVSVDPLLALALPNPAGVTRLGVTVSSKVGNAVVRVRIRRRLRELFRKRRAEFPSGVDLVLIGRSSAATMEFAALSRAFGVVAQKLRALFP